MEKIFYPPRRAGLLILGILILGLAGAGAYFFFLATQDPSGLDFLLHMLLALVILSPLPLLVYRLYALMNGAYGLRRDGLLLRWGLRREDIPLNAVEWVRPASEMGFRLPLPWLRLPGALLGTRKVSELGLVEFIASDTKHMILVATPEKVYAISPENPNQFMSFFRQVNELGSLVPLQAQSVYPKVLIGRVWEDKMARRLILGSLAVGLVLLIVTVIAIPGLETVVWTGGEIGAPAERLLLLPVLDSMIWIFNLVVGIFLYRRGGDLVTAAYFLWGTAGLTGILLLIGSLSLIF
jgi:hypothetical protein